MEKGDDGRYGVVREGSIGPGIQQHGKAGHGNDERPGKRFGVPPTVQFRNVENRRK